MARHCAIWATTRSRTQQSMSTMRSLRSAKSMNWSAPTMPWPGTLPAHQRLEAGEPVRERRHDGLVVDGQLVVVDGAT